MKIKRYSRKMQCLAHALQSKGPKAFKMLRKLMGFPAARSLRRLSNSVDFQPGICDAIVNPLQVIVEKMDPKDRVCCLLFDEMCIRSGVYFNDAKVDS